MLASALEAEDRESIERFRSKVDENRHRQVVRYGYDKSITGITKVGNVSLKAPRLITNETERSLSPKYFPLIFANLLKWKA